MLNASHTISVYPHHYFVSQSLLSTQLSQHAPKRLMKHNSNSEGIPEGSN